MSELQVGNTEEDGHLLSKRNRMQQAKFAAAEAQQEAEEAHAVAQAAQKALQRAVAFAEWKAKQAEAAEESSKLLLEELQEEDMVRAAALDHQGVDVEEDRPVESLGLTQDPCALSPTKGCPCSKVENMVKGAAKGAGLLKGLAKG